ncbi:MAG: cytochrome c [Nitrospirae bacterium]|nr:cytochrome c [Nitrospirota bacterium]
MKVTILLIVIAISIDSCSALIFAESKPLLSGGENLYIHYCSPCHGVKGDGNGFNAKNLDPRPAVHTDANFMSRRTDKDLYDALATGGKGIGKSTLMPPWGDTFDKAQIKSLVKYLRELCRCQGE